MLDTVSIYFLRQNEIYCKMVYYMALFRKTKFALKFSQFLGKMAYQIKSNWPTAVEGNPKAPFSVASTSW